MQDDSTNQPTDNQDTKDISVPDLNLEVNPPAGPTDAPASDSVAEPVAESTVSAGNSDSTPASIADSGDLESIKASALQELAPIVGELDLEPEEKYRALMMLIQSSGDQKLIKEAFDAAHKISDSKTKADALLTIINEINYLTGKGEKTESPS